MFFRCNCFRPERENCGCLDNKNYSFSQDNKDYSQDYQSRYGTKKDNKYYCCEWQEKKCCYYNRNENDWGCNHNNNKYDCDKKDYKEAIKLAKIIYEKGYEVFIQPMLILTL